MQGDNGTERKSTVDLSTETAGSAGINHLAFPGNIDSPMNDGPRNGDRKLSPTSRDRYASMSSRAILNLSDMKKMRSIQL
jgi:hypothetical protein